MKRSGLSAQALARIDAGNARGRARQKRAQAEDFKVGDEVKIVKSMVDSVVGKTGVITGPGIGGYGSWMVKVDGGGWLTSYAENLEKLAARRQGAVGYPRTYVDSTVELLGMARAWLERRQRLSSRPRPLSNAVVLRPGQSA